jgi:hypothetical protein
LEGKKKEEEIIRFVHVETESRLQYENNIVPNTKPVTKVWLLITDRLDSKSALAEPKCWEFIS